MMLKATVFLTFGHVAVNLWTEDQADKAAPLVLRSIRHTYVQVPDALAELSEEECVLEALRWAVVTALQHRRGQGPQLGSP